MTDHRSARSFVIEAVVIVASILLAFGVDAWWGEREERALEAAYLERLVEDLSAEKTAMRRAASFARSRVEAGMLLDSVAAGTIARTPDRPDLVRAIETVTWRSFPVVDAFVYGELQSTGRLNFLTSEPLRRMLADHYAALRHDTRVGEDLSANLRYESAIAGVLTVEEQYALEGGGGEGRFDLPPDPGRAAEIARGFRARPGAVRELGNLVQHHTFNLRVIEQGIDRADEIIGYIRVLQRNRIQ